MVSFREELIDPSWINSGKCIVLFVCRFRRSLNISKTLQQRLWMGIICKCVCVRVCAKSVHFNYCYMVQNMPTFHSCKVLIVKCHLKNMSTEHISEKLYYSIFHHWRQRNKARPTKSLLRLKIFTTVSSLGVLCLLPLVEYIVKLYKA